MDFKCHPAIEFSENNIHLTGPDGNSEGSLELGRQFVDILIYHPTQDATIPPYELSSPEGIIVTTMGLPKLESLSIAPEGQLDTSIYFVSSQKVALSLPSESSPFVNPDGGGNFACNNQSDDERKWLDSKTSDNILGRLKSCNLANTSSFRTSAGIRFPRRADMSITSRQRVAICDDFGYFRLQGIRNPPLGVCR